MTSETSDPRRIAWEVLNAVEDGAFADSELTRRLAGAGLPSRDRALATRLVYGTLAWRASLDFILRRMDRPAEALDVPLRNLLRMALLQLTKLSRVPDFAAVDTAVELSKDFRRGAASGLVNALLRRFLREHGSVPLPDDGEVVDRLSVELSHPSWLVERCLRELGREQTEAFLAANNDAAPTVLRVNRGRVDRETVLRELDQAGVAARPTSVAPDGIELESGVDVVSLPGYAAGRFTLQGEASQLVALFVAAAPGGSVLDVCSAPGGKATDLAQQVGGEGRVVAVDRSAGGINQVRRNALRLGLSRLFPVQADARLLPLRTAISFDAVLIDAPCSGLGTLRQHPEIRWRRGPRNVTELAALQSQLLDAAACLVKKRAGVLVYSTCTVLREENENVVETFLAKHDDFRIESEPESLQESMRQFVDAKGFFRTWPQCGGLDGFFAARLRRKG